jgi:hypothetical protein
LTEYVPRQIDNHAAEGRPTFCMQQEIPPSGDPVIRCFHKAVERWPEEVWPSLYLGECYAARGEVGAAGIEFVRAMRKAQNNM